MFYDLTPLFLTFKLALIVTGILFFIGIPIAYWISFTNSRFKYVIESVVSLPLVLPPTVLGFYLLLLLSPSTPFGEYLELHFNLRFVFTFSGLVIGSVIFSLPFMVNPLKAGFQNLPASLSEAAFTLGKSKWETLVHVLLPNIQSSLLTGVVMSFAHTVGEFGVVLMIGGNIPGQTKVASIAIFNEVEALNYSTAGFYSIILVAISFLILLTLYISTKREVKVF